MNVVKHSGYVYYFDDTSSLKKYLVGKWMYFFNDKEFVSKICEKAIAEKIVVESKHSDSDEGVACFYININDFEAHKRVLAFFLDNKLIKHTKKEGRLYNISFKLDSETHNGQYRHLFNFDPTLKLEYFIDLQTEQWILSKESFEQLLPFECFLLDRCNGISLDKEQFGVDNAEDYIHRAFPPHIPTQHSVVGKKIHFWQGKIPRKVFTKGLFFIVRFRAIFYLKENKEPFIVCKTTFMYPPFKPLETSDIYNPKDGLYYDSYIDFDKTIKRCFPEFTLTREDFLYFNEIYDVAEIKIKDGCYFE